LSFHPRPFDGSLSHNVDLLPPDHASNAAELADDRSTNREPPITRRNGLNLPYLDDSGAPNFYPSCNNIGSRIFHSSQAPTAKHWLLALKEGPEQGWMLLAAVCGT